MSSSRAQDQLIQDLVDGHLSAEEERELVARMVDDPELVDAFVAYTGLDIGIENTLRFSPASLRDLQHLAKVSAPKSGQVLWLGAAAAAVLVGMMLVMKGVMIPEEPPVAHLRASPGTHYEIVSGLDREDAGGEGVLFDGESLVISQGVVAMEFASSVHAVVEGPAELRLENEHFVRLLQGEGRFRVPPEMSGFRVGTPDLRAIDLGTEFGVEVVENGPDEVHVLAGRVDVSPIANPERGEVLQAGEAMSTLRSGLLQPIRYEGGGFFGELPSGLPYLHLPMELEADGSLVVQGNINGAAGIRARYHANDDPGSSGGAVQGRFGGALGFNGTGDHVVTDWMGIGGDDPRTVAFWVRIRPGEAIYDTACVVWGYRGPGKETVNRKWNVQLSLDRATRSRCILNTTFGGLWMEGSTALDDGNWHHVAAVYGGQLAGDGMPDLRLYVDGAPENGTWVWNEPIDRADDEVRVRTEVREELEARPLALARAMHRSRQPRSSFRGELDEVYVIAGVLRPEDVRSLWQSNQLKPKPVVRQLRVKKAAPPGG